MDTITISYRQRPVATAGTERFWLAAHIQALPNGHPDKRLVAFMALYARDILRRELPGPYSDERALEFARLALVDSDTYAAHRTESEEQLADTLGLPADQIPEVHRDQARARPRTSFRGPEASQDRADSVPTHAQERPTHQIAADLSAMKPIQIIELDGRPAALVAGDEASIAKHITGADLARVQAKALYAIEIRSGTRPGPYADEDAELYAERAAALRTQARQHVCAAVTRLRGPRRG